MMTDIHPNMPPISLVWFTFTDWVILSILLLGVLAFFAHGWRHRPQPEKIEVQTPDLPPSQNVLRKLKKLIEAEDWKNFCTESSDAFKHLISAQYGDDMVEKTTEEIISWAAQNRLKGQRDISQFFSLVDPIKYAGVSGQKAMAEKSLDIFKSFYQK